MTCFRMNILLLKLVIAKMSVLPVKIWQLLKILLVQIFSKCENVISTCFRISYLNFMQHCNVLSCKTFFISYKILFKLILEKRRKIRDFLLLIFLSWLCSCFYCYFCHIYSYLFIMFFFFYFMLIVSWNCSLCRILTNILC